MEYAPKTEQLLPHIITGFGSQPPPPAAPPLTIRISQSLWDRRRSLDLGRVDLLGTHGQRVLRCRRQERARPGRKILFCLKHRFSPRMKLERAGTYARYPWIVDGTRCSQMWKSVICAHRGPAQRHREIMAIRCRELRCRCEKLTKWGTRAAFEFAPRLSRLKEPAHTGCSY